MIFGSVEVTDKGVVTHRDTYLFPLSVVSVRRPLLVPGVLIGGGLVGFVFTFSHLLWIKEMAFLLTVGVGAIVVGKKLGQLQLLSMTLRGSELSGAVFGTYQALNKVRASISEKLEQSQTQSGGGGHGLV